jgi:hypothetical protein
MSELPLDEAPGVAGAAYDAARGQVVYLTENGEHLAAIVPAAFAAALDGMTPEQARELIEDLADAAAPRESLAEPVMTFRQSRSGLNSASRDLPATV